MDYYQDSREEEEHACLPEDDDLLPLQLGSYSRRITPHVPPPLTYRFVVHSTLTIVHTLIRPSTFIIIIIIMIDLNINL